MRPIATPTKTGTAPWGTDAFGLVAVKMMKHKNAVPKASINVA
jgi:hypothetical protein